MRLELLDALGPDILTDAILAALEDRRRAEDYEVYVTDLLRAMAQGWGASVPRRFWDILHPQPEDSRTAEEIAADIMDRMGLSFGPA